MSGVQPHRAADAFAALSAVVRAHFPAAQLRYRESPDGLRWYLDVVTDCEDDFTVLEVAATAAVELFLAQGILVHVFAFRHPPSPT